MKLNNNDDHLSLGNLFRIIKEISKNKTSALQSEIFCSLFDIESINDTTVNNYCVGCRSIGSDYKQIFLNKEKKYMKNKEEFISNLINILSIIDGNVYFSKDISFIKENESAIYLCKKLYNLSKNDKDVPKEFSDKLNDLIKENKIYEVLVEELLYIVLYKKQPVYETELKREVIEDILNDTNISANSLQEYLSLKLREGINYDYSLKKLALKGNALANYELGSNEYYGFYMGYPRYDVAYKYLSVAAYNSHAAACYMIGSMYINGLIGNKSNEELEKGYSFLVKACELGNVAANNLIGNMYLKGIHPLKKSLDEAFVMYKKASEKDYVYAFNNLGKIEEDKGDYEEAFNYYLNSANLGESWACNKIGEFYRLGIIKKNMEKAFSYYEKALDSNYRTRCYYAYYNLAKYFYLNGYDLNIKKDEHKALEYFDIACKNGILEAAVELFLYYVNIYLKEGEYEEVVMKYKKIIEKHPKFNKDIKILIENKIKEMKCKLKIEI